MVCPFPHSFSLPSLLLGLSLNTDCPFPKIRARGQVTHISTGPRASSVNHNTHRCG
ncbi:hypothetical protein BC2230_120158 [Burkholderia cepacia]